MAPRGQGSPSGHSSCHAAAPMIDQSAGFIVCYVILSLIRSVKDAEQQDQLEKPRAADECRRGRRDVCVAPLPRTLPGSPSPSPASPRCTRPFRAVGSLSLCGSCTGGACGVCSFLARIPTSRRGGPRCARRCWRDLPRWSFMAWACREPRNSPDGNRQPAAGRGAFDELAASKPRLLTMAIVGSAQPDLAPDRRALIVSYSPDRYIDA